MVAQLLNIATGKHRISDLQGLLKSLPLLSRLLDDEFPRYSLNQGGENDSRR